MSASARARCSRSSAGASSWKGQQLVQHAGIAAGNQVVDPAANTGQKTMSPCESPARTAASRSKNMNHCGRSPSAFWALKVPQQQVAHGRGLAQGQQYLDRTAWQTSRVPQPPPSTAPSSRGDKSAPGRCAEPGQHVGHHGHLRRSRAAEAGQRQVPDQAAWGTWRLGVSATCSSMSCTEAAARSRQSWGWWRLVASG